VLRRGGDVGFVVETLFYHSLVGFFPFTRRLRVAGQATAGRMR
jgi:hypothetical protein